MDPFTALIFAALIGWGATSSGLRDTLAVAKGQTPPGHAERMAKIAAQEHATAGMASGSATGGYAVPPSAETRKIRLADLARHWWEQALEDADDWRQHRHDTRPERKAARERRRAERKQRESVGHRLLREWAERKLDEDQATGESGQSATESAAQDEPAPQPSGDTAAGESPPTDDADPDTSDVRDAVRDAQRRAEQARQEAEAEAHRAAERSAEPSEQEEPSASAEPDPDPVPDEDTTGDTGQEKKSEEPGTPVDEQLLVDRILAAEARQHDVVVTDVTQSTPEPEPMKALPPARDEGKPMPTLDLSDANSLDSHVRALNSYGRYYDGIAGDLDQLAAGMRHHQMGHSAVGAVVAASAAHAEAAAAARTAAEALRSGHQPVAEAFAASPEAADGDYNKSR